MSVKSKDYDDAEKWENGELGASEEHIAKAPESSSKNVDDALGLQLISIRLQKALIEELKALSKEEGIGYQPLMRQILTNGVKALKEKHQRTAIST